MITRKIEIVFHKGSNEDDIKNCIEQIRCHMTVAQVIELN